MAQSDAPKLDAGIPLPDLPITLLEGGRSTLRDWLAGRWGVLLFYRGHW